MTSAASVQSGNMPSSLLMMKKDRTYTVSQMIDLKGETIMLPPNGTILFQGGILCNGTVVGNNTLIKGDKTLLFRDVIIKGSFRNHSVYSEWFELKGGKADNKKVFDAIMALAVGNTNTDVYIQSGDYYTSVGGPGNGISIPSNTHVHNESSIYALPSSLEKYNVITIKDVENVTFEGGRIIGDVGSHSGSTGEWGYGISLTGARNSTIQDVHISRCWGDGINVQALYSDYQNKTTTGHCRNIIIKNVVCDSNRRQGMSIEGCIGISVSDSRFINTGIIQSTLPTAGIDIEPWFDTEVVKDVQINNCVFADNKGGNLIAPFTTQQWANGQCKGFVISNNIFDDNVVRFNRTRDLIFVGNEVGIKNGLLEFNQYSDIRISSNEIHGKVNIFTEGNSEDGIFEKNKVSGGERLSLALEKIDDNEIEGYILLRENVNCVLSNNKINAEGSEQEYSLICDNTILKMYGNHIRLSKPMIFRYKSNVNIYNNQFYSTAEIHPACLILQTARNPQLSEDGIIRNNIFKGGRKFVVNYSAKGKYAISNNLEIQ